MLTFMATGFLSDEKQIGARLEKEIEMYCSNKALERLKDIVARDSHRNAAYGRTIENNDILHKYWDFFTTYSRDLERFRYPQHIAWIIELLKNSNSKH